MTARRLLELAQEVPTASSCLEAARAGFAVSARDRAAAALVDPKGTMARAVSVGARLVAVHEDGYPRALLDLYDPPAGLFVRGSPLAGEGSILERPCVAIVGARNCSAGGKELAASLAQALAAAGSCVVSGAARGIDAAAHRGALAAGGASVAVLGSGIDVAYPTLNQRLIEQLVTFGAVVSEYPPGIPAEPFRFPARNRIVAALSKAVVVVEGGARSGSRITADHALDLGRDVFAVPGAVWSELAQAPLKLLREGAGLIRGSRDLLDDLGLQPSNDGDPRSWARTPSLRGLAQEDRTLLGAIRSPTTPDDLAASMGWPMGSVLASLMRLELAAAVRQVGGRYERRLLPRGIGLDEGTGCAR